MSSEQNVPEGYEYQGQQAPPIQGEQGGENFAGQDSPHGMGQSKSSRRRRRKRKNKGFEGSEGGDQAASAESPAATQVVPSMQAGAQSQPSQPQPSQPQSGFQNQGGQQNANGTKRWKKKFRDRDRPRFSDNSGSNPANNNGGGGFSAQNPGGGHRERDTHQPGNTVTGFKRKGGGSGGGKQRDRGPRSFVGPMDHSYRAVNGNFIEGPPSTIATHGHRSNGRGYTGDSQPIDYSQGRPVPIPEDAPTKIVFFIDDLFLTAKINETSRKLGVKVAFVKNDKESLALLTGAEEADRPGLIVIDLNNASAKPMTLIPKLKAKLKKSTSIIGFLSQIQGELKSKAVEVGCDTVMARAAFSQNLPNLLRRYGIPDEEESNFNC